MFVKKRKNQPQKKTLSRIKNKNTTPSATQLIGVDVHRPRENALRCWGLLRGGGFPHFVGPFRRVGGGPPRLGGPCRFPWVPQLLTVEISPQLIACPLPQLLPGIGCFLGSNFDCAVERAIVLVVSCFLLKKTCLLPSPPSSRNPSLRPSIPSPHRPSHSSSCMHAPPPSSST